MYEAEQGSLPAYPALRWIAVLPAAVTAALIGPALVYLSQWLFGSMAPSRFEQLFTVVAQSAAMGAAFVWAGSCIAPTHQGRVAIVLAATAIFVMGGAAVLFLQTQQWMNLGHALVSATAAAAVGYVLHDENG